MLKKLVCSIFFHFIMSEASDLVYAETIIKAPNYFIQLLRMKSDLAGYGLILDSSREPDVILTNRLSKEILARNIPIIVLEDFDYATISERNGSFIADPLVKAIFQTYSLRPLTLNYQSRFASCFHLGIVNKYACLGAMQDSSIPKNFLDKVHCVPCTDKHPMHFRFDALKKANVDFKQKRLYDVFFVGSTSYSIFGKDLLAAYKTHRESAIHAIQNMNDIKSFVRIGRALKYSEYIEKIKDSKIVVSPWGYGEFCYRDFEAMLSGAIVVKPDSAFVQTIPDIYQNNITYVPCAPDFSDLAEIVDKILKNYDDYLPMRVYARKIILSCNSKEVARNFAHAVHAVLKPNKNETYEDKLQNHK